VRLADRYAVGEGGDARLLGLGETIRYFGHTLGEFAGARGPVFVLAFVLALAGGLRLLRTYGAFVAVAVLSAAIPLVLLVVTPIPRAGGLANVSTRHLIYLLPVWAAFIGAGMASALVRLPRSARPASLALVSAALLLPPPSGVMDPRTRLPFVAESGRRGALASPARWLRDVVVEGDALFSASPPFLAALPDAARGRLIEPAPGRMLGRSLQRLRFPVPGVVVAAPLGDAPLDVDEVRTSLGERARFHVSRSWLVVRVAGPFPSPTELLRAVHRSFEAVEDAISHPPPRLASYLRSNLSTVCAALRTRGQTCHRGE
jgi:hypothetical protein